MISGKIKREKTVNKNSNRKLRLNGNIGEAQ
jgi:hypothetical protein